jgi:hypothetical protein
MGECEALSAMKKKQPWANLILLPGSILERDGCRYVLCESVMLKVLAETSRTATEKPQVSPAAKEPMKSSGAE